MQFKKMFKDKILSGEKTQTRRPTCNLKVGQIVPAQNGYKDKAFARLKITSIRKENMLTMTDKKIKKEGFECVNDFVETWLKCFKYYDASEMLYVINFKVVKETK